MKGLALGSGDNYHGDNWTHLDKEDGENVDVVHDLRTGELPFNDNEFDKVIAVNVLEHLPQKPYEQILAEIGRVTKTGGLFQLTGPHQFSRNAVAGDHFRSFSENSMKCFCADHEYPTGMPQVFNQRRICFTWFEDVRVKLLRSFLPDFWVRYHVPNSVDEVTFYLEVVE